MRKKNEKVCKKASTNAAAIYCRVSTVDQVENGCSLDAQIDRLSAYATASGLDVVAVFREEAVSGTIALEDRPEGKKLVSLIASGAVKHVIVLKLDRLFRSAVDALTVTTNWDKKGISTHFADMGGSSMNTGSAVGKMILTVFAGMAELERNLIGERTALSLAHKKKNNMAYSPTPFGKDREEDRLTDNREEMDVIADIHRMREEGISLRAIVNSLNQRGIPTKQGKRWHVSTIVYILKRTA